MDWPRLLRVQENQEVPPIATGGLMIRLTTAAYRRWF
jgi:hypothetical protein